VNGVYIVIFSGGQQRAGEEVNPSPPDYTAGARRDGAPARGPERLILQPDLVISAWPSRMQHCHRLIIISCGDN
jgi:hypothetical protein